MALTRPGPSTRPPRSRLLVALGGAAALVAGVCTASPAQAVVACSVTYTVTSQWPGGFGADVRISNLGDALTSWRLAWSFGAGQTITQLWNGSSSQSGAQVVVSNASYNAGVPAGGSVGFGFNGAWSGSNPAPTDFVLNGTACTGPTTGTTTSSTTSSTTTTGGSTTTTRPTTTTTSTTSTTTTSSGPSRPCDLYAGGGTPCVAAHSTTRALYRAYSGSLYQVTRASDNTTRDIGLVAAGGVADAATQDSFCANTTCQISIIYDQSGRGNHLTRAPAGYWKGPRADGSDNLADAKAAPITVGGRRAYGVFVAPGTGYRNNRTNGIATGDQAEGIYAVVDGTHYSNWCCFDYGNAQTDGQADSPAIMETVYFGADKQWGWGDGNGPWVMGDLEWGLFSGSKAGYNPLPVINNRFVTGVVKGQPGNHWAIRSGNAQSGGLTTNFSGARPSGYNPMKKEGAILLGIGGDNSTSGAGTFYEGVMTSGYPSDATEALVQADIVSAGYKTG